MPYTIKWNPRYTYSRFTGCVTGEEIIAHASYVHSDERFDSLHAAIVDFTDATDIQLTLEQIRKIAAIDAVAVQTNPRLRIAIVSTSETMDIGSALYARDTAGAPLESKLFRSVEEAQEWIGLDDA